MNRNSRKSARASERGNVLFYILIAVVLLAALSFAVSQSGRGNVQQLSEERARLYAGEIIDYASVMATAVSQLRLRGVAVDQLCFDHTSWGHAGYNGAGCADDFNNVYTPDGGAVTWTGANSEAMDVTSTPDNLWHIYSNNSIDGIGTTCAAHACADLLLMVDELNVEVCRQINNLLGITNPAGNPPVDVNYFEDYFDGDLTYDTQIGGEAGGEPLTGQTAACFEKTTGPAKYAFYKVLIAR